MQKLLIFLITAAALVAVVLVIVLGKPRPQNATLVDIKKEFAERKQKWGQYTDAEKKGFSAEIDEKTQSIIRQNPDTSEAQDARLLLNDLFEMSGDHEKQIANLLELSKYQQVVSYNVNISEGYYYQALELKRKCKICSVDLKERYDDFYRQFPNSSHVDEIMWYRLLLSEGNKEEYKELLKRFFQTYTGSRYAPEACMRLCKLLWKDGDMLEAFKGFNYLIQTYYFDEKASEAFAGQFAILRKRKETEEAARRLRALFLNLVTGR